MPVEPNQDADTAREEGGITSGRYVAPADECEACMDLVQEPCPDHAAEVCDHPSMDGIDLNWGPDKLWRCTFCGALLDNLGEEVDG
jgi:hypothetical protein